MKFLAAASAALSLLLPAAAATASAPSSRIALPAEFAPPSVFKNTNLVHVISLEKNYAKETVNVAIENVDAQPQQHYFLPFTSDQISRIGGFEVKDRKDADAGPFEVSAVDYDSESDVQFYRITLPAALTTGGQQTLSISYYVLEAYAPKPAAIEQDGQQFLEFVFSPYINSAYPTTKQKTELKMPSASVPDYTKLSDEVPVKQGSKLTYGPFGEKPAGAVAEATVRFEFTKPVTHVADLRRDVEISHWGGNVAFEEHYDLYHRGANLTNNFDRVRWAQSQYFNPVTYALKELRFPLRVGSGEAYYTDVVGNVSTSRFRSNKREALLEAKPRYPVFGGWRYPFTVGWNSDAKNFVRQVTETSYVLNVPFLEGPKQPEGVEYEKVHLRVILPEGAENIKYHTAVPTTSITASEVHTHRTFLDTTGRTVLALTAQNLVDELRDRELLVTYDVPLAAALRKPAVVFASLLSAFVGVWALGKVDLRFSA